MTKALKSDWGIIITDRDVKSAMVSMSETEQRIFMETMNGMVLANHNLKFLLPQILTYVEFMAMSEDIRKDVREYHKEIHSFEGVKIPRYMVVGQKGNFVNDPRINQAKQLTAEAMNIATRNGLTLKSRSTINQGPEPEKPKQSKKKQIQDKL